MLSIKFNMLTSWANFVSTSTGAPAETPCQVPVGPLYGVFTVPSGAVYGVFTVPATPAYGCST